MTDLDTLAVLNRLLDPVAKMLAAFEDERRAGKLSDAAFREGWAAGRHVEAVLSRRRIAGAESSRALELVQAAAREGRLPARGCRQRPDPGRTELNPWETTRSP